MLIEDQQYWKDSINEALQSEGEHNHIDFKLKLSDKNERLKEHINAFGNLDRGGCFVFGVEDFKIVGVKKADKTIKTVTDLANHSQEPSLTVDSFTFQKENKQILCLHVRTSTVKPVFIKDRQPLGGKACFKRSGSSTIAMSTQEIRTLLALSQETFFDESAVNTSDISQLNFDALHKVISNIDLQNISSDKNIAALRDYKILTGTNREPHITVAGWLCFANDISKDRIFNNAYIEFQIFKGITRDTPLKKHEIRGSLTNQIEKSINLLMQNIWFIPKIVGTKREEIPAYSPEILREVITNSLVHRDYKIMHQPVKISMFDNRIEIENPGSLMPGLTIYNMIHRRNWRNPLLAELMKRFGFGEMDGQGIDRIYSLTLSLKVPPPNFKNDDNSFTVTLSAPKSYDDFSPDEKRLMVMILLLMNNSIDNESLRNCFGITSDKAGTLLKSMVEDKIIKNTSVSRKYAKYEFTKRYRDKFLS